MSFFHLPDEDYVRTQTDYTEIFTLTLLWNVGLLGMLVAFLFFVFLALKMYQLKILNQSKSRLRDSLLSSESRQQSQRLSQQRHNSQNSTSKLSNQSSQKNMQIQEKDKSQILIQKISENPNDQMFTIINFLTSFFFYVLWICIGLIYLVFYMFGYFGRGLSHDILAVFIMTILVAIPTLIWKSQTKVKSFKQIKRQVIFATICIFIWLGISVFAVISLKGACLCYYNDNYGLKMSTDLFLSTQWTRTNAISKICNDNQICNLYATVPQDPSTAVFINIHTGINLGNITLRMTSPTGDIFQKMSDKPIKLLNVQQIGKRYVHSVLFMDLQPNTMYKLEIIKNDTKTLIKQTRYKTVPDYNSQTVKMAIGGDVSMTKQGELITSYLLKYDPDIIIIGGDIAYDDGMRTCYYSWDNFYNIFETLNNKIQRLIPMVLTIGNHDVGFDAFTPVTVSMQFQDIPLFFLYNPQHFSISNPTEVPALNERSSIHYHVIGPSVHLHLDSGYISSYESQVVNIKLIGEKYKNFYLFANYHNPLYPSCTNSDDNSNDRLVIDSGKKFWLPNFDHYGFVAGFQHHTHHKKFTKKMKNNTVSTTNGMRFVGDGSWGVKEGPCPKNKITKKKQMFQFFDSQNPNHIWQITLSKVQNQKFYQINYTVINMKGQKDHPEQIDNLTQFSPKLYDVNLNLIDSEEL